MINQCDVIHYIYGNVHALFVSHVLYFWHSFLCPSYRSIVSQPFFPYTKSILYLTSDATPTIYMWTPYVYHTFNPVWTMCSHASPSPCYLHNKVERIGPPRWTNREVSAEYLFNCGKCKPQLFLAVRWSYPSVRTRFPALQSRTRTPSIILPLHCRDSH